MRRGASLTAGWRKPYTTVGGGGPRRQADDGGDPVRPTRRVPHGDPDADLTLIGWGSTKPVILETMSLLKERQGLNCNFLQVIYMSPFPTERVTEIMNNAKRTIALENNATGQLAGLIREHTGCEIQDKILKYNGRQFFRDELADLVVQHL